MTDALYSNIHKRWQEVMMVPPQNVGPLTPYYKKVVPFFKTAPWRIIIPIALLVIAIAMISTSFTAAGITSVLQRAF